MGQRERWVTSRLAEDTGEAEAELMAWSDTVTSVDVSRTLLAILKENPPLVRSTSFTMMGWITALVVGPLSVFAAAVQQNPFLLAFVLVPMLYSAWLDAQRPRVALRATLMLARLNDERAIPYLTQCWAENHLLYRDTQLVTEELTRLLADALRRIPPQQNRDFSGGMHARTHHQIAHSLREFLAREFPRTPASYLRDLTEAETDLFLGVVRYLAAYHTDEDTALLTQIAQTETNQPNRLMVAEAAHLCLHPVKVVPTVAISAVLPTESPRLLVSQYPKG
jgi:hypothetical protein